MANVATGSAIVARTEMRIRKPVEEVFAAFVDPAITSRFWFTRGSGRLEPGKEVRWDWEMYGVSVPVAVRAVETDRRIVVEWNVRGDRPSTIELTFKPLNDGTAFVSIVNGGFAGGADEVVRQALDATEGFTLVLAGLKALLEHGIRLELVADRFPAGLDTA
jgi:uncharacterized protein YndB with AHSA1/START domain